MNIEQLNQELPINDSIEPMEVDMSQEKNLVQKDSGESPVNYREVIRLIKYAGERGLDPEGNIIAPLYRAVETYNKPDDKTSFEEKIKATEDTLILYGKLTELTYLGKNGNFCGINGKTLLDTESQYRKYSYNILIWGVLFLIMAVGTESLDLWFSKNPAGPNTSLSALHNLHMYFLDAFSPFWWGALGACVFLMKRLSDRAAECCFDSQRWKGWGTRIMLGALLGLIIAYIYAPQGGFKSENLNLDTNALAFFTGVGVRIFYGGIERAMDVIAEKFNLGRKKEASTTGAQPSPTNP